LRIGIVAKDAGEFTTALLIRAVQRLHHTPVLIELSELVSALNVSGGGLILEDGGLKLDGVIVRDVGAGRCEKMGFRLDCLKRMEDITVLNAPDVIFACADKHIAQHMLSKAHVPSPPAVVVQSEQKAVRWIERLGEVVLKPPYGYEGRGMARIGAHEPDIEKKVHEMLCAHGVLIIQQFVPCAGDTRVLVVGERVVGCVRRVPEEGGWLSNIAQGGRATRTRCTQVLEELALSSAEAVGAAFAGVDIIQHTQTGDSYVLEVNATPSFRAISELCGADPAPLVVELLTG